VSLVNDCYASIRNSTWYPTMHESAQLKLTEFARSDEEGAERGEGCADGGSDDRMKNGRI
jgi:hypothetical protein